ncbi:MAG: ADP-ribosylglycohydrolase family protein [Steroidobacteraceae bacterium]
MKKPIANSYWVRPSQLLAGEYPLTANDEESAVRLQDMLLAGVTNFIDLTAEYELTKYAARLPKKFGGRLISYQRFALTDHGVPDSAQQMNVILDAIDSAIQAGGCVYVHCRAGIGRTGTVIGCHLVRHGHSGARAIEALNELWQSCARSRSWLQIPETDQQETFIREFRDIASNTNLLPIDDPRLAAYQGVLLGLMLGNTLGGLSPLEEGVAVSLTGASWSGEAAMALAMADSLLHCQRQTPLDQMQRYLACQQQGKYTTDNKPGSLPDMAKKALGLWQWKRNPLAGSHDPAMLDAHPLLRCVPVALFFAADPTVALSEAAESARTTSQAPVVLDACRVFTAALLSLLEGMPVSKVMLFNAGRAGAALRSLKLKPELGNLIDGGWRTAMTHPAGEDCLTVLSSALHAVATTNSFQAAVFKSMHKAARPATVGALCGALAGALYGVQGMPIVWRETLIKSTELMQLSERLLIVAPCA